MKFLKTKMKRLALRTAALALVVSFGAVAIMQLKHSGKTDVLAAEDSAPAKKASPSLSDLRLPQDPFSARGLKPRPAMEEPGRLDSDLPARAALMARGDDLPRRNPLRDAGNALDAPRRNSPRDTDDALDAPRRMPVANNAAPPQLNDPFGLQAERPNPYAVKRTAAEVPAQRSELGTQDDPLGPAPRRLADSSIPPAMPANTLPAAGSSSADLLPPADASGGSSMPPRSQMPNYSDIPQNGAVSSTRIEVQTPADTMSARGAPGTLPAVTSGGMNALKVPGSTDLGAASDSGNGRPGARQLEGAQTPQLQVEKIAPPEVQVGKSAIFKTKIRNVGTAVAQGVEIHDEIPHGAQLVKTTPPIQTGPRGELIWAIGTLKPNDETTVQMELIPTAEGEIGSVASVQFRSEASARSVVTKPALAMQLIAPKQAMIGTDVKLTIKLSNPGTGVATGVLLEEKVPVEFKHAAGAELEFEVGQLKPGETRQLDLTMSAVKAGKVLNTITARGEGSLRTEQQAEIEIVAPALEVAMNGPTRRYLERQATYTVSVSNPGTAPAKDIQLVTHLPKGLKFVKANNSGQYDAATHSVQWNLEELPASETGNVTLVTMPIESGEQKMTIDGKAKQGLVDHKEQTVVIDGLAAVMFEVSDVDDPIEIGQPTTYEIRVVNQGTKPATNIQVLGLVPAEAKPLSAEGPTRFAIAGQQVTFEPLARLAPKADVTYKVKVQALAAGDLRFKVQLLSDDSRTPITKEESTRVYSDQ